MKVALLLPANIYFCPYVKIYIKILEDLNVEYDILAWDRVNIGEKGGVIYKTPFPYGNGNKIKWFINYYRYSRFLKLNLKKGKYDRLVVFGPQVGLFLFLFLKYRFKKKICFDFRDIFIEQMFPKFFKQLLKICSLKVISSPDFKTVLPAEFDYVLSHNLDIDVLNKHNHVKYIEAFKKKPINIVTIGAIRDYEENNKVMMALSNNPKYFIKFIGTPGPAGLLLKNDAVNNNIVNIEFIGFYNKGDEPKLIAEADFLNIFYPDILSHSTALSNRFYNALIFKKPMIVTKNSIQGKYVEKYNLGIAIENCTYLDEKIQRFIENFDNCEFIDNCNNLLNVFKKDYEIFKEKFEFFLEKH